VVKKEQLQRAFQAIKKEFEEHLDGINKNTEEIQTLFGYLQEVEGKVDKLMERLDTIEFSTEIENGNTTTAIELNIREQEVFTVIYCSEEAIQTEEIAKRLGFTPSMINSYIYRIISKGVPLIRDFKEEKSYIKLDPSFKDLQMRKNILKIDESVSRTMLAEKMI
tara:strand:+ start:208 stop:702 length:495 start_codon:yes stop_codon:yes gene_type:complete